MLGKKLLTRKEESALQMRLKELRNSIGYTQEQMAKALFISRECWSNYEAGHRIPGMDIIKKIADFFGVDVNYVMGLENTNRETSEFLYSKMQVSKYITKEGYIDISDLHTIDKIEIIDFCEYLRARRRAQEKHRQLRA